MRFAALTNEAQQGAAMAQRTRDVLFHKRTQMVNAGPFHLSEQGIVLPLPRLRSTDPGIDWAASDRSAHGIASAKLMGRSFRP